MGKPKCKVKVDVKLDDDAIAAMAQEAMEAYVASGDMTYECPRCGKPIRITGSANKCACGFVLNVETSRPSR